MKKHCYTGLSGPVYFLGIPLGLFLLEALMLILCPTIFSIRWYISTPIILGLHFLFSMLFKWDDNWMTDIIVFLSIPTRKMHKKREACLPDNDNQV